MKLRKRKIVLGATLAMVLMATIVWGWRRAALARRQSSFLASVTGAGGSFVMDYEADGQPAAARSPLWLRDPAIGPVHTCEARDKRSR